MLGRSEARYFVVESEVLVRTPNGWRIAMVHESSVPADFGSRPDFGLEHGGMKFADVVGGSPADKAGFKVGDVMIEFGGQKVDNSDDYYNVLSAHYVGDKVVVTVMRGQEKITKIVMLEGTK
jgi:S1-C subfamily serine protease